MSKTTFQTVAEEFRDSFTRDNPRGVWTLKDDSPDWMRDALRDAHTDGRLPDDWIYENCRAMVDSIADCESADDCDTCEIADGCVDICTADLTKWLASSLCNIEACEEAVSEGLASEDADLVKRMSVGQYILLDRACAALISAIDTQATACDDAAAEEENANADT
jgi:hypothetical protein